MPGYFVHKKEKYTLIQLGSNVYISDRSLPMPHDIPEIRLDNIVLDVSSLASFSSPTLNFISTILSYNIDREKKIDVIDSKKESRLEKLLEGTGLRDFVNIYASVEEYEKARFRIC